MLTKDDLIDALVEHLQGRTAAARPSNGNGRPGPAGRVFLSEHEVRKRLTPGSQVLRIPKGAIVSPLAQDWLALKAIRILEE